MPSVGLDLVEIGRVQKAMKRSRFCRKILGGEEYRQLEKRGFPPQKRGGELQCQKRLFPKPSAPASEVFPLPMWNCCAKKTEKPYLRLQERAKMTAEKAGFNGFLR